MEHGIISIGREFGSGGHKVGQLVADRLKIGYYDNELITLAAQYGEISEDTLTKADEKRKNDYLYEINYEGNWNVEKGKSLEDTLYELQKKVILQIAEREDAVIVGRSADDILKQAGKKVLSVFIKAPQSYRVERTMELEGLDEKTVLSMLKKKDKRRKAFYESRTGKKWGSEETYDLVFDSSVHSFGEIADEIIKRYQSM